MATLASPPRAGAVSMKPRFIQANAGPSTLTNRKAGRKFERNHTKVTKIINQSLQVPRTSMKETQMQRFRGSKAPIKPAKNQEADAPLNPLEDETVNYDKIAEAENDPRFTRNIPKGRCFDKFSRYCSNREFQAKQDLRTSVKLKSAGQKGKATFFRKPFADLTQAQINQGRRASRKCTAFQVEAMKKKTLEASARPYGMVSIGNRRQSKEKLIPTDTSLDPAILSRSYKRKAGDTRNLTTLQGLTMNSSNMGATDPFSMSFDTHDQQERLINIKLSKKSSPKHFGGVASPACDFRPGNIGSSRNPPLFARDESRTIFSQQENRRPKSATTGKVPGRPQNLVQFNKAMVGINSRNKGNYTKSSDKVSIKMVSRFKTLQQNSIVQNYMRGENINPLPPPTKKQLKRGASYFSSSNAPSGVNSQYQSRRTSMVTKKKKKRQPLRSEVLSEGESQMEEFQTELKFLIDLEVQQEKKLHEYKLQTLSAQAKIDQRKDQIKQSIRMFEVQIQNMRKDTKTASKDLYDLEGLLMVKSEDYHLAIDPLRKEAEEVTAIMEEAKGRCDAVQNEIDEIYAAKRRREEEAKEREIEALLREEEEKLKAASEKKHKKKKKK